MAKLTTILNGSFDFSSTNVVDGSTGSSDNELARFNGTGGDTVQNSGVTLDDSDNLAGHGQTYQTKAADFTLSANEAGTTQECASGAAFTVTMPSNANDPLPVGYTTTLVQGDGNAITFSGQSGVTLNSKNGNTSTNGQWSAATIIKTGTDTWLIIGDLA